MIPLTQTRLAVREIQTAQGAVAIGESEGVHPVLDGHAGVVGVEDALQEDRELGVLAEERGIDMPG